MVWVNKNEDFDFKSFCNAVPTKLGGTHETGFKNAILKGLKSYGIMIGKKKCSEIIADDIFNTIIGVLSIFIKEPQFQGQTKEKLVSTDVSKKIESTVKDRFELWLSSNPKRSEEIIHNSIQLMEERKSKRIEKELSKKSNNKIRLPIKLCDCTTHDNKINELSRFDPVQWVSREPGPVQWLSRKTSLSEPSIFPFSFYPEIAPFPFAKLH